MDPLVWSVAAAVVSLLASALAQLTKYAESTTPYADFLKRIERILSGKPVSTRPLETQLNEAVEQLTSASQRIGNILSEVQQEIERRQKEATQMRSLIVELQKEYERNKSLANLTADQANAVRQLLSSEVSVLKRRSYLPDILINFGVGAFFFMLGIWVTLAFGR